MREKKRHAHTFLLFLFFILSWCVFCFCRMGLLLVLRASFLFCLYTYTHKYLRIYSPHDDCCAKTRKRKQQPKEKYATFVCWVTFFSSFHSFSFRFLHSSCFLYRGRLCSRSFLCFAFSFICFFFSLHSFILLLPIFPQQSISSCCQIATFGKSLLFVWILFVLTKNPMWKCFLIKSIDMAVGTKYIDEFAQCQRFLSATSNTTIEWFTDSILFLFTVWMPHNLIYICLQSNSFLGV